VAPNQYICDPEQEFTGMLHSRWKANQATAINYPLHGASMC